MSIISFSGVEKLYKVKKKQEGRFAGLRNFFSNEFILLKINFKKFSPVGF